MTYERTVAAAVAETRSKFALAEALAEDIPPRQGRTAHGETSTRQYIEEARKEIETAGGEPYSTDYLMQCRAVALWVIEQSTFRFRWISGVSFTAHNEARMSGLSYEDFAATPKKTVDAFRKIAGRAGTDGPPEKIADSWTPEQKASVARELLSQPDVAEQVADEITDYVASDSKRTADVVHKRRQSETQRAPVDVPEPQPVERDYDAMVEQHINGLSVVLAAESSGKWHPSERSEALLYFLTHILGNRREPTGEQADVVNEKLENLFAEVEAYANSEVA